MNRISFIKAEACGNDFIILDRIKSRQPASKSSMGKLAQALCPRKLSVGADGLLLLESAKQADFKMRVFNPDGQEVQMCGNGARCAALYAYRNKIVPKRKMSILTEAGNLLAEIKQDRVKIKLSAPKDLKLRFDLNVNGQTLKVNYINTGVPHVVCFVQDLEQYNVQHNGQGIRYHSEFQPQGTNANFVQVIDKNHIRVRTYERGVEQETLACGTGCVASAIITACQMQDKQQGNYKILVQTQSKETLSVYFKIAQNNITEVFLEGKAKLVYSATT